MNKLKLSLLTMLMVLSLGIISYADNSSITADNNVKMTQDKHYPVVDITNHTTRDITVEWGAYGDKYQGDILVPGKSTVSLELKDLAFLGNKNETTRVWITWNEPLQLKPLGTQVDTIPFKALSQPSTPPIELG
ncbi:hypothetical protein [Faecalimicrobium sp. JNUCC 81]